VPEWQERVARARGGDREAFEQVVRRFQAMAVGYAYSLLGDFHWAQDAAQEAFVDAYYHLGALREPAAFPAWLRRVVRKHCDRLTRRRRLSTVALEAGVEDPDPAANPAEAALRQLERDAVLRAVSSLPEHERTVTALYYIDGYSVAEVGAFLEVPQSTVKNRLHSARGRLREGMVGLMEETLKGSAPGDEFGRQVSRVLEGIERTHWETTSVLCFTGSVVAAMHHLGEPVTNDYVMGISGGAFKMFWIPPWSPANCDLLIIGEEPIRQTFAALGYDYTFIPDFDREKRALTEAEYRRKIVESIDAGRPVMAIGIVGPPEVCVVAGYSSGGEVLYGRSYFQEQNQESSSGFADEDWYGTLQPELVKGYFRSDDWYDHIYGLILIGDKKGAPAPGQVLRNSLEWAVSLARVPQRDLLWPSEGQSSCYSGLAAYDQMIEGLLRDEDFPPDVDKLTYNLYALGNDGAWLMVGKRRSAAAYLERMLPHAGAADEALRRAAVLYLQQASVWERAARLVGWTGSPDKDKLKLTDRRHREQIARFVREAKALEAQTVTCLEEALTSI
jgi:RNA polymerase sigma factor (sigma-70 family)